MASIYKCGKVWWVHYHVAGKSACRSLKTTSQPVPSYFLAINCRYQRRIVSGVTSVSIPINTLRPSALPLAGQTTTLVIGETDPLALEMLTKHPVLFLKVLHDVLLLPIQPSGQRHHQNLPRMSYHEEDSAVSKCCWTGRTDCSELSCKPFVKHDLQCG